MMQCSKIHQVKLTFATCFVFKVTQQRETRDRWQILDLCQPVCVCVCGKLWEEEQKKQRTSTSCDVL